MITMSLSLSLCIARRSRSSAAAAPGPVTPQLQARQQQLSNLDVIASMYSQHVRGPRGRSESIRDIRRAWAQLPPPVVESDQNLMLIVTVAQCRYCGVVLSQWSYCRSSLCPVQSSAVPKQTTD